MAASAVDVISPAIRRTTDMLFRPFRFGMWWRLAIISLLAGEISGSGGGPGNYNFQGGSHGRSGGSDQLLALALPGDPAQIALVITALAAAGLVLFVILVFLNSVFRFVLFDAVVTGRYRIREGFRRWSGEGRRYFWWQLAVTAAMLLAFALFLGLPVLAAWQAGIFRAPGEHVGLLLLGGILLFVLFLVLLVAGLLLTVFSKDFLVPVMALEKLSALDGWRRLWPMLRAEGSSYAGYIGMKIVLALGAAMIFGILDLIVIVLLLIPGAAIGVAVVAIAGSLGLTWNPLTIALAVVAGGIAALLLIWLIATINVPAAVFFQSYPLLFLAARYPALDALLHPAPPPAPAPAPASA